MNTTVFWHLLWKEYRLQRSLWLAIAVLGLLIQLWFLELRHFGGQTFSSGFAMVLYGSALVHAWLYAMGCGAVLFAAEHENGTYDFQRALPVSSQQVFAVKVVFGLLSTAVLMGVLLLLAAVLSGGIQPPAGEFQAQWGIIGFASLEVLAWTIFFSLLLHGPLKAAILGVTASSFVTYFLLRPRIEGIAALEPRAAVLAIVAVVDCVLGWRWFRDSSRRFADWMPGIGRLSALWPARGCSASDIPAASFRATMLARLTWQHWRQSGWMLAGLGALSVMAIALTMILDAERKFGEPTRPAVALRSTFGFLATVDFWFLISALAPTFLGVFAFRADQRGASFRFLADRGVSPRLVWLSRQLTWFSMVAMGTAVMLLALGLLLPIPDSVPREPQQETGFTFFHSFLPAGRVLALVAFGCAIGQFCSMLLASGILASVLAVVLSLLAVWWVGCITFFQMSWLWAVAPFPLAMLWATWLRAPGWMAERRRWRNWLVPGAALMVPALAVVTAVFLVRAHEVPDVSPGFSLEQYAEPASPEAAETARMYLHALDLYVPWNAMHREEPVDDSVGHVRKPEDQERYEAAMLKANQKALELTLKAARRPSCDFFAQVEPLASQFELIRSVWKRLDNLRDLGRLVAMNAERLEREGKLDPAREQRFAHLRLSADVCRRSGLFLTVDWTAGWMESDALRGLVDWARRPGQSSEKVLDALHRLDRFLADVPAPSEPIQWAYWHARQLLVEQPAPQAREPLVAFWTHTLPWERERTRRVLDQITATGMEVIHNVTVEMAAGRNPRLERFWTSTSDDWWRRRNVWVRNTFLGDYYSYTRAGDFELVVRKYACMEAQRRATRILLALEAWRLDHAGQLPTSLDALKGKYLEQIPLDPCSGEPFRYYAQGRPAPLTPLHRDYWVSTGLRAWGGHVAAGEPFLWSIGTEIQLESPSLVGPDVHKLDRYRIHGYSSRREPSCEEDLLVHGWAFPLPKGNGDATPGKVRPLSGASNL